MYVHAYQSYIWNAVVSERIRLHGAEKPIPGDIVFEKDAMKESDENEIDEAGTDDEGDFVFLVSPTTNKH